MTRFATIDVGSNSVLIHIAEKDADGVFTPLADKANLSRLGEGLQESGCFTQEAMDRTLEALRGFVELARSHQVEAIAAVGTMALRNAKNSPDLLARIKAELELEVEVIPGEEEARLSFMAVRSGLPKDVDRVVIFDVGGGSTEFIFGAGREIVRKFSRDIGALRLTADYLPSDPVNKGELDALMRHLCDAFKDIERGEAKALVGMGGAMTNMSAVNLKMESYDPKRIQGSTLSLDEMQAQLELFCAKTIAERRALAGLQPKRADTILAGAAIVTTVIKQLQFNQVSISDRGIRHGLMKDRFG